MYNLLRRVDGGLQAILSCVSQYLIEEGKKLVMEDEGGKTDAITFVQVFLYEQHSLFLLVYSPFFRCFLF